MAEEAAGGWFVDGEAFPVAVENARGDKAEIRLQRSNAGLRARIAETVALRSEEAGLKSPPAALVQLITVQEAIAGWTLPGAPPTPQLVAVLDDELVDLLFIAFAIGEDPAVAAARAEAEQKAEAEAADDPTDAAAAPPDTDPEPEPTILVAAPAAAGDES